MNNNEINTLWRGRTCGECAWWRAVGICRRYGIWCQHYGLSIADGQDPACPAFWAREEVQPRKCVWWPDEYTAAYHTACGHLWEFTEGGLVDNDTRYCPYCGGKIVEQPTEGEENDE